MDFTFLLKRGNAAQWQELDPVLGDGEPGVERDTHRFKFGDGVTHWNDLQYAEALAAPPYIHIQGSASDTWVIDHNRGYEPPAIQCWDSFGNPMEGDPEHVSVNRSLMHFSSAEGGRAIVD